MLIIELVKATPGLCRCGINYGAGPCLLPVLTLTFTVYWAVRAAFCTRLVIFTHLEQGPITRRSRESSLLVPLKDDAVTGSFVA